VQEQHADIRRGGRPSWGVDSFEPDAAPLSTTLEEAEKASCSRVVWVLVATISLVLVVALLLVTVVIAVVVLIHADALTPDDVGGIVLAAPTTSVVVAAAVVAVVVIVVAVVVAAVVVVALVAASVPISSSTLVSFLTSFVVLSPTRTSFSVSVSPG